MNYTCYAVEKFDSLSLNSDISTLITNTYANNRFLLPMPGSCGGGINYSNLSPTELQKVTEQNEICKSKKNNKAYISMLDYINKNIGDLVSKYPNDDVNNEITVRLLGKNQYGIFTSLNIPKDFTLPAEENAAKALVSQFIDRKFGTFCCEAMDPVYCDSTLCQRNIVLNTIKNTIDTPSQFYQEQIRVNLINSLPDLFYDSNTPVDFTITTPIVTTPTVTTPVVKKPVNVFSKYYRGLFFLIGIVILIFVLLKIFNKI